jgi:putative heme iron utilization protein
MIFLFLALLVAEPTAEELAFKLVSDTKVGTACTTHKKGPFGSVMPYAVDAKGQPLVFLSDLAVHTKNIKADSKASIFVTEPSKEAKLDNPRVTLIGKMVVVPEKELKAAKELYFKRFPEAKIYEDFHHLLRRRVWSKAD